MKKWKDFFRRYQADGEAEVQFEFSIWHLIIIALLIGLAIYTFSN